MSAYSEGELAKMTVTERVRLIGELWDSLAKCPNLLPLSEVDARELDRRLADYKANPDATISWEEARARALRAIGKQA